MRRREKYKYTLLSALGTGLLGTGLYLLRDRLADQIESVSDRAKDVYDEASGRVRRASRVMAGEDRSGLDWTAVLLLGIGVGVGLGSSLLLKVGKRSAATSPTRLRNSEDEFVAGRPASCVEPKPHPQNVSRTFCEIEKPQIQSGMVKSIRLANGADRFDPRKVSAAFARFAPQYKIKRAETLVTL